MPVAVLSTTFFTTGMSKAHAAVKEEGFVNKFIENGKIENNPYADKGFNFNFLGIEAAELQQSFQYLVGSLTRKVSKFDDFTSQILENSIKLLSWVYETLVVYIIQTPAWVFNNSWFADSYGEFSLLSVIFFTFLCLINGTKKIFNKDATKLQEVVERYFLAVVAIGFGALTFEYLAKFITAATKLIVSLGYHSINTKDFQLASDVPTRIVDTLAMVGFDVVLLGLMVTTFIQNGRRWFILGGLGVLTPFALSAWVYQDKRYLFNTWKENFTKLLLTQLYNALFITLMGIFIAGTTTGLSTGGLFIKLSVVIGGLTVMASPPAFISNLLDRNRDSVLDMFSNAKELLTYTKNPAYAYTKDMFDKTKAYYTGRTKKQPTKKQKTKSYDEFMKEMVSKKRGDK